MNTKLRCLLLDDELNGLTYLKMLCEQVPELEVVKAFNNPSKFLAELPELNFDLCILDIEMPVMNGLQIANLLKGSLVIFTTAYKEYAAEAFDLDAVDYVRKPLTKERLEKAVRKAVLKHNNSKQVKDFFLINSDKGKTMLFFNQIHYIHTSDIDSRDKVIITKDGSSIIAKNYSFKALLEELPDIDFCQVNKSMVISLKEVSYFTNDEITTRITLSSGKQLKVYLSDIFKDEFLKRVRS